ncbi:MAG: hypothetical protein ACUZ8H_14790, partial [Candidatus Anammoxibacter sp.]
MQKNVASQKIVVFAFNRTTNVPLTGDAANITANIQKDFGSSAATNDVNPTELEDGFYAFDATQAETNADNVSIYPVSSTSDIQVIGVPSLIVTVPPAFADDVMRGNDTAPDNAGIAGIQTDLDNTTDGLSALKAVIDTRMAETSISTTGGAVNTVTTLTNKTGFSLSATGLDLI